MNQPSEPTVISQLIQIPIEVLRRTANPNDSQQIKDFLNLTAEISDDCVVQLTQGHATLLTDDEGRFLSFK